MNESSSTQQPCELFQLSADDRYANFLQTAVEQQKVWTLRSEDGYVAFRDDEQRVCFPFWPTAACAQALADEEWSNCQADALDLPSFMDLWLPGMNRDARRASVFPTPDGSAVVVEPMDLLQDLRDQMTQED